MPVTWEISHVDRLVTIKAQGLVTLSDVEAYMDAIVVDGAISYRKLVDCRSMEAQASDMEMLQLGARLQAYIATLKGGAIAFVATTVEQRNYMLRYINLSTGATRPAKIFDRIDDARRWLEEQKE